MLICKTGCGLRVGKTPGICAERFPQLHRHFFDRGRSLDGLRKRTVKMPDEPARPLPATVKYLSTAGFAWRIGSSLSWISRCCCGEAPSCMMKSAADDAAVAGRQKRERQSRKEKPDAHRAGGEDRHRQPAAIEKPVERSAVEPQDRLEKAAGKTLRPRLACPGPRSRRMRAHISGVSVNEIRPEAKMATMIVTANSRKIRPSNPGMKTSGIKTAASERVMERMVNEISPALLSVAR